MVQHTTRAGAPASGFTPGRGLLLVVLATAIGVLLLARAVDPSRTVDVATGTSTESTANDEGDGDGGATATSEAPAPSVTTIPPARQPAEVTVIVFNARNVQGAAAANKDELMAKGFNVLSPETFPEASPTTIVYYAEGYQADGLNVATTLTIAAASVVPFPPTGLPDMKGAKVAVVLGTDGQGLKPS